MKSIAFDTLEFSKWLRAAEFSEKQAEALAAAVAEIVESRLATKEDITLLQRGIKELETSTKRDLQELELRLKHDLTLRLGGMLVAGIGIVPALVKML
jgi:predicted phage-related endonuclease